MPDDEKPSENPTPEQNSIPPSPQEPTADAPILPMDSEPANAPSEALESSPNDFPAKSNDIPPSDSTHIEPEKEPENQASSDAEALTDKETAQTPVNEPLESKPKSFLARELLITARNAIQFRKRKKLDKVMSLFLKQSKITNDEVEKFLHVSDATATRYLSILEKENKIKQVGKTGKGVSYSRI